MRYHASRSGDQSLSPVNQLAVFLSTRSLTSGASHLSASHSQRRKGTQHCRMSFLCRCFKTPRVRCHVLPASLLVKEQTAPSLPVWPCPAPSQSSNQVVEGECVTPSPCYKARAFAVNSGPASTPDYLPISSRFPQSMHPHISAFQIYPKSHQYAYYVLFASTPTSKVKAHVSVSRAQRRNFRVDGRDVRFFSLSEESDTSRFTKRKYLPFIVTVDLFETGGILWDVCSVLCHLKLDCDISHGLELRALLLVADSSGCFRI